MSSTLEHSQPRRAVRWTALRKVGFCWTFCYLLLYYGAALLRWIPGVGYVLSRAELVWQFWMYSLAVALLHPSQIIDFANTTGSGDKLIDYVGNAVYVLLAGVGTAIWSVLDRRRDNYESLEAWLRVFARYSLALTLLSYGMSKVVPTQFQHLDSFRLDEPYGASSPMALLWNFMGYSTGYTVFAGLMEVIPAVLLFFRRTALLGALIAFPVLVNVVALNLCYDVPVKLFSVNLLLLSGYLLFPYVRPLWRVLVQGETTAPLAEIRVRFRTPRLGKVVLISRAIFLTLVLLQCGVGAAYRYYAFRLRSQPPHSLLTDRGFHWTQEQPFNR